MNPYTAITFSLPVHSLCWRISAVSAMLFLALVATYGFAQDTTSSGNAERGEALFKEVYKCYACHGYNAQTGYKRLKPMRYSEEAFTRFVQTSPLERMPAYADVPDQALADIYAYILSIPEDAPEFDEIPVLDEIRERNLRHMKR